MNVRVTKRARSWVREPGLRRLLAYDPEPSRSGDTTPFAVAKAAIESVNHTGTSTSEGPPAEAKPLTEAGGSILLHLQEFGSADEREGWVMRLAAALDDRGLGGVIDKPRSQYPTDEILRSISDSRPMTLFLGPQIPQPEIRGPGGFFHKPPAGIGYQRPLVQQLSRSLPTRATTAFIAMNETFFEQTAGAPLEQLLASLATTEWTVGVTLAPDTNDTLQFQLGKSGKTVVTRTSREYAWLAVLDQFKSCLVALADQLDLGFIRHAHHPASWESIFQDGPPLPSGIQSLTYFDTNHLWLDYVIDAHGVQILTEQHLAKANDLAAWSVKAIAPGRYLVESKDPDAWFATPEPDAQTLADARADFGDLIITSDLLLQERSERHRRART